MWLKTNFYINSEMLTYDLGLQILHYVTDEERSNGGGGEYNVLIWEKIVLFEINLG
jgi:hypothetical protein